MSMKLFPVLDKIMLYRMVILSGPNLVRIQNIQNNQIISGAQIQPKWIFLNGIFKILQNHSRSILDLIFIESMHFGRWIFSDFLSDLGCTRSGSLFKDLGGCLRKSEGRPIPQLQKVVSRPKIFRLPQDFFQNLGKCLKFHYLSIARVLESCAKRETKQPFFFQLSHI